MGCNLFVDLVNMLLLHISGFGCTLTTTDLGFFPFSTSYVTLRHSYRLVLAVAKLRPPAATQVTLDLAEGQRDSPVSELQKAIYFVDLS